MNRFKHAKIVYSCIIIIIINQSSIINQSYSILNAISHTIYSAACIIAAGKAQHASHPPARTIIQYITLLGRRNKTTYCHQVSNNNNSNNHKAEEETVNTIRIQKRTQYESQDEIQIYWATTGYRQHQQSYDSNTNIHRNYYSRRHISIKCHQHQAG